MPRSLACLLLAGTASSHTPALAGDVLIADGTAHHLARFSADGDSIGTFATGALAGRNALAYGPDRRLYVLDSANNAVLRYNAITGEYLGEFVTPGSGGLSDPRGMVFAPDGKLYITGQAASAKVARFDAQTGAFESVFALAPPFPRDIAIGPDGNIYVICEICQDVIRFNITTGASMGRFVDVAPDGCQKPYAMEFGPDGHLYITSSGTEDAIRRYNGNTGAFINVFADHPLMDDPFDLKFSPDGSTLYVSCQTSKNVVAFDGSTGAFLSEFASPGEAGLGQTWGLAVMPCFSDHDGSGFVDLDDFIAYVHDFEEGTDNADFDQSGFVDLDDFIAFVHAFENGC
ncbi:MAG: beta-propeller fold lactonase family protein [Phycisphaerales bacterium]|nr:beta-propeller fold lactonase family protein [Phycisphaerales bacterium]